MTTPLKRDAFDEAWDATPLPIGGQKPGAAKPRRDDFDAAWDMAPEAAPAAPKPVAAAPAVAPAPKPEQPGLLSRLAASIRERLTPATPAPAHMDLPGPTAAGTPPAPAEPPQAELRPETPPRPAERVRAPLSKPQGAIPPRDGSGVGVTAAKVAAANLIAGPAALLLKMTPLGAATAFFRGAGQLLHGEKPHDLVPSTEDIARVLEERAFASMNPNAPAEQYQVGTFQPSIGGMPSLPPSDQVNPTTPLTGADIIGLAGAGGQAGSNYAEMEMLGPVARLARIPFERPLGKAGTSLAQSIAARVGKPAAEALERAGVSAPTAARIAGGVGGAAANVLPGAAEGAAFVAAQEANDRGTVDPRDVLLGATIGAGASSALGAAQGAQRVSRLADRLVEAGVIPPETAAQMVRGASTGAPEGAPPTALPETPLQAAARRAMGGGAGGGATAAEAGPVEIHGPPPTQTAAGAALEQPTPATLTLTRDLLDDVVANTEAKAAQLGRTLAQHETPTISKTLADVLEATRPGTKQELLADGFRIEGEAPAAAKPEAAAKPPEAPAKAESPAGSAKWTPKRVGSLADAEVRRAAKSGDKEEVKRTEELRSDLDVLRTIMEDNGFSLERALGTMPPDFRQPLIAFLRQHGPVDEVAVLRGQHDEVEADRAEDERQQAEAAAQAANPAEHFTELRQAQLEREAADEVEAALRGAPRPPAPKAPAPTAPEAEWEAYRQAQAQQRAAETAAAAESTKKREREPEPEQPAQPEAPEPAELGEGGVQPSRALVPSLHRYPGGQVQVNPGYEFDRPVVERLRRLFDIEGGGHGRYTTVEPAVVDDSGQVVKRGRLRGPSAGWGTPTETPPAPPPVAQAERTPEPTATEPSPPPVEAPGANAAVSPEHVVAPALMTKDGRILPGKPGELHADVLDRNPGDADNLHEKGSGFITDRGRFVDVYEAGQLAEAAGQRRPAGEMPFRPAKPLDARDLVSPAPERTGSVEVPSPEGTATPAPEREPWQMTQREWRIHQRKAGTFTDTRTINQVHQNAIAQAIAEGKDVPAEVLAEYPKIEEHPIVRGAKQRAAAQPEAQAPIPGHGERTRRVKVEKGRIAPTRAGVVAEPPTVTYEETYEDGTEITRDASGKVTSEWKPEPEKPSPAAPKPAAARKALELEERATAAYDRIEGPGAHSEGQGFYDDFRAGIDISRAGGPRPIGSSPADTWRRRGWVWGQENDVATRYPAEKPAAVDYVGQVLYHGTPALGFEIPELRASKMHGVFLTPTRETAAGYAGPSGRVLELRIRPGAKVLDATGTEEANNWHRIPLAEWHQLLDLAEQLGVDMTHLNYDVERDRPLTWEAVFDAFPLGGLPRVEELARGLGYDAVALHEMGVQQQGDVSLRYPGFAHNMPVDQVPVVVALRDGILEPATEVATAQAESAPAPTEETGAEPAAGTTVEAAPSQEEGNAPAAAVADNGGRVAEGERPAEVQGPAVEREAGRVPEQPRQPAEDVARPAAAGAGEEQGEGGRVRPAVSGGDVGARRAPAGDDPARDPGAVKGSNYRIAEGELENLGGPKTRARQNLDAIRILKQLQAEQRPATREEQSALVRYVGWGGLADMFPTKDWDRTTYRPVERWKPEWEKLGQELRDLLTPDEYETARRSTQYAHFTSEGVIGGIYAALERLGVTGSPRLLEPAAGIGHFIGLSPLGGRWTAVEMDGISAGITAALYPRARVLHSPYQKSMIADDSIDVAISNVPFNDSRVADKRYKAQYVLHDYFFVRSLDKVRPGGIVAFITSTGTMDKASRTARAAIAAKADLLGAVRLPSSAFEKNAATSVTTDVLFLRKRLPGETPAGEPWMALAEVKGAEGGPWKINEYFAAHPEMMLGKLVPDDLHPNRPAVRAAKGADGAALLREAVRRLPENVYTAQAAPNLERAAAEMAELDQDLPENVKEGQYLVRGDGVVQVKNGRPVPLTLGDGKTVVRVKALVGLGEAARKVLALTSDAAPDPELRAAQKELGKLYDAFFKTYGAINKKTVAANGAESRPNLMRYNDPVNGPLVAALENYSEETGEARKAAIFTERLIEPREVVEKTDTAWQALVASLVRHGKPDLEYMAQLYPKSPDEIVKELGDAVYLDPETGHWQTRESYLSGNVREKLATAREAAEADPTLKRNVEALEKVQPKDLEPAKMLETHAAAPGATWIEPATYREFLKEVLGQNAMVEYRPLDGRYSVRRGQTVNFGRAREWQTAGTDLTEPIDGLVLFDDLLNGRQTVARYTTRDADGNKVDHVDQEGSLAAEQKKQEMSTRFQQWALSDDTDRTDQLVRRYNDLMNNTVLAEWDGAHLAGNMPGLARMFRGAPLELGSHQINAVWRFLANGNTLLAHEVGGGKTITMVIQGMEARRMGLARKPLYVVPNHMLGQFSREFLEIYPAAKILVADDYQFHTSRRREFLARAATDDWDAIILTHSSLGKIPVSPQLEKDVTNRLIGEYEEMLLLAQADGERFTVKALEKALEKFQERLATLNQVGTRDDVVYWEQLGVDLMFVDEAHEFKNLALPARTSGIAFPAAGKTTDLYIKTRHLERVNPGRGIVFATATPISNTIGEMYVMMRYLMEPELESRGYHSADGWANDYVESTSEPEFTATGALEVKHRPRHYRNAFSMAQLFRGVADVKTRKDLDLPTPKLVGDAPEIVKVPGGPEVKAFVRALQQRWNGRPKKPQQGDDNVFSIMNDGRYASVDARLVVSDHAKHHGHDPTQPWPHTKAGYAAERIFEIWKETKAIRGTQLVFSDLGVPKDLRAADRLAEEELGEDGIPTFDEGEYDIYNDIKARLVKMGIPAKEIAFAQESGGNKKKRQALFDRVKSGEIRVLIGSTPMMGQGTNVQDRLVALHHIDVPWKPAWVEQRDGRIVRRGNLLYDTGKIPGVRILRYVLEGSFDTRAWQIVENKAGFIQQAMTARADAGLIDEPGADALSMKEAAAIIKALASDNPYAMDYIETQGQVRQLEIAEREHASKDYRYRTELHNAELRLKYLRGELETVQSDIAKLEDVSGDAFTVTLQKKVHTKREEASKALAGIVQEILDSMPASSTEPAVRKVGRFAGFDLYVACTKILGRQSAELQLRGESTYTTPAGDEQTAARRLAHLTDKVPEVAKGLEKDIASVERDQEHTKTLIGKPFPRAQELADARARYADLSAKMSAYGEEKGTGTSGDADWWRRRREEYKAPAEEAAATYASAHGGRGSEDFVLGAMFTMGSGVPSGSEGTYRLNVAGAPAASAEDKAFMAGHLWANKTINERGGDDQAVHYDLRESGAEVPEPEPARAPEPKSLEDLAYDTVGARPTNVDLPPSSYGADLFDLARQLDASARYKHMRKAFGRTVTETGGKARIELADVENMATLAHEIGHALDYRLSGDKYPRSIKARFFGYVPDDVGERQLRTELARVSNVVRPVDGGPANFSAERSRHSELLADFYALYLLDPERARKLAPNVADGFEAKLADDPRLHEAVQATMQGRAAAEPDVEVPEIRPVGEPRTITPPHEGDYTEAVRGLVTGKYRMLRYQIAKAGLTAERWRKLLTEEQREDLGAAVEHIGNVRTGKTAAEVEAGLSLTQRRVLKEYRLAQERARQWLNRFMRDVRGDDYIGYIEDYLLHFYTGGKKVKKFAQTWARRAPSSKERKLPTYEDAVAAGLTPITQDIATLHELWAKINWRAALNDRFIHELSGVVNADGLPVLMKPKDAPPDWPIVDHPAIRRVYARHTKDGQLVLWEGGAAVDPEVYRFTRQVFEQPFRAWPVRAIETANAFAKRSAFYLSLFHHITLNISAQGSLASAKNPLGGFFLLGRHLRGGLPVGGGFRLTMPHREGLRLMESSAFTRDLILHGVNADPVPDVMVGKVTRALHEAEARTRKIPGLGFLVRKFRQANTTWDRWLWNHLHTGLKGYVYYSLVQDEMARMPDGASPAEIRAVKEKIAEFINDAFGGQEWESKFWLTPKGRQAAHIAVMAPDWTLSDLNLVGKGLRAYVRPLRRIGGGRGGRGAGGGGGKGGAGATAGNRAMDRAQRRYWRNALLTFGALISGLNYALSGKWPWENEPDHKRDIDVTSLVRKMPWRKMSAKDAKRRYYISLEKQFRFGEAIRWLTDPVSIFGAKLSPFVQTAIEQVSGHQPGQSGWPMPWAETEMGFYASLPARTRALFDTFVPFSVRSDNFAFTFPLRKGMGWWRAQRAYEDLIRAQVDPSLYQRLIPQGDATKIKAELDEAATANGLDPADVYRQAASRVRASLYDQLWQAVDKKDDAEMHRISALLTQLGAKRKNVEESGRDRKVPESSVRLGSQGVPRGKRGRPSMPRRKTRRRD